MGSSIGVEVRLGGELGADFLGVPSWSSIRWGGGGGGGGAATTATMGTFGYATPRQRQPLTVPERKVGCALTLTPPPPSRPVASQRQRRQSQQSARYPRVGSKSQTLGVGGSTLHTPLRGRPPGNVLRLTMRRQRHPHPQLVAHPRWLGMPRSLQLYPRYPHPHPHPHPRPPY